MGTFVLIISSVFWGGHGVASTNESIPGFTSMDKCMSAGAMHTQKMLERKIADRVMFTCNAM